MNLLSPSEIILSKMNEFYQVDLTDSDERVKFALQQLLYQWSEVLTAGDSALDDELFALNVSRAFLFKVFIIAVSKHLFINDHSFTREFLRTSFDLLVNHTDIFTNKNITSVTIFLISNIRLIMDLLSNIFSLVRSTDLELFHENDYQLFIAMREYVNQDFKHDSLTDDIISFIWNISDNTSLVPLLLKTDYARSIVEWIKIREKKFRVDKQDGLIYILLNIARHDDGIEQFNSLNVLDVIEQIQFDPAMSLQLSMIRVLLTDVNYMQMEMLNTLVQLTIDAARNEEYRHEGSHVCEPLTVLTKLCSNDEILHNVFCKMELNPSLTTRSMIELFVSLLIKFYPNLNPNNDPLENFTCVLVFNMLWLISNHQEYCQIICDDEQVINIIKSAANNEKNFVDTFMPRTMKDIQQAAIEIGKKY
jgi:hypothetical protein